MGDGAAGDVGSAGDGAARSFGSAGDGAVQSDNHYVGGARWITES